MRMSTPTRAELVEQLDEDHADDVIRDLAREHDQAVIDLLAAAVKRDDAPELDTPSWPASISAASKLHEIGHGKAATQLPPTAEKGGFNVTINYFSGGKIEKLIDVTREVAEAELVDEIPVTEVPGVVITRGKIHAGELPPI